MRYQKEPSKEQTETLLDALRYALESGNEFMVIADLGEAAIHAGSGRESLLEFVVSCMMANDETAQLILNCAMNFMANKIMHDVCDKCEKAEACGKKQKMCDPEEVFNLIKTDLEKALNFTKSGLN